MGDREHEMWTRQVSLLRIGNGGSRLSLGVTVPPASDGKNIVQQPYSRIQRATGETSL